MDDKTALEYNLPKITQGINDEAGMCSLVPMPSNAIILIIIANWFLTSLFIDAAIVYNDDIKS